MPHRGLSARRWRRRRSRCSDRSGIGTVKLVFGAAGQARTLLRERGAGRRILVLYALAFKHFEDLLIGDAATVAQVAHLG